MFMYVIFLFKDVITYVRMSICMSLCMSICMFLCLEGWVDPCTDRASIEVCTMHVVQRRVVYQHI